MLGRIHGSVEQFYVPRLHKLYGSKTQPRKDSNLYRLSWDPVDNFKQQQFLAWAQSWKDKFPSELAGEAPGTLPSRYDRIVQSMAYSISHDYAVEIKHFMQLYYLERHRVRHFDTVIRDMCADVSHAAVSCAFKLLVDCAYDEGSMTWFRGNKDVDRHLLGCLLIYKFWREATGRGLVWELAGLDKLERWANERMENGNTISIEMAVMYRRCTTEIKEWELEQEKYRSFVTVPPVGEAVESPDLPTADEFLAGGTESESCSIEKTPRYDT